MLDEGQNSGIHREEEGEGMDMLCWTRDRTRGGLASLTSERMLPKRGLVQEVSTEGTFLKKSTGLNIIIYLRNPPSSKNRLLRFSILGFLFCFNFYYTYLHILCMHAYCPGYVLCV